MICNALLILLCFFDNIAYAVQYNGRTIGVLFYGVFIGNAGENQNRGHTAFQTGDHVRIHPVADHHRFCGVALQNPKAGAHHERIWFSAKIGLLSGGNFDGRDQRTAGGHDAILDRSGYIGIGADQLGAV